MVPNALAATTELASVPVAGTGQAAPKPNVMLLMDTSRSMAFTHMPDELEGANLVLSIGYRSAQCNSLYYDPAKEYKLPKKADGTLQPTPSFGAARYNFYSTDLSTVDLSSAFRAYDRSTRQISIPNTGEDAPKAAYYYQFEPSVVVIPSALDYRSSPCTNLESTLFPGADLSLSVLTASTSGGVWKRKLVTAISGSGPVGADERLNFAIWYTYYRTRMAMVKSSISLAFNPVTEKFRVGLVSMNPLNNSADAESGVAVAKYLAIDDFTPSQKSVWYSKLFDQVPDGSSPAREGLARVGRHYAGKMDGINKDMTPDPVKNSCQQNFTIMTTDGYWNTAAETRGPVGLDGVTLVGNMDGSLTPKTSLDPKNPALYSHRPMWDGTTSGQRTDTNVQEQSRYAACDSGQFYKTTSVVRRATAQTVRRTQGLTVTTSQTVMSSAQTSASTTQSTRTTSTATRQTLQRLASTQQTTLSTRQELQTTKSFGRGSSTVRQTTTQNLQDTSYMEKYVFRRQSRTVQIKITQTRVSQSTSQLLRSTSQPVATTSQLRKTETQVFRSTTQPIQSTTRATATTTRQFERTSQLLAYNGVTEQSVPVATCTSGGNITCITLVSGPTAVASCSPQTAAAGNNYLARTCDAPVVVGPTAVASCTVTAADAGNNYTSTACGSVSTGPTAVASCTPASPSAANSYTTVSCATNNTGPTLVASCAAGTSASFVTTSCNPVAGASVPVASCTAGTNATTMITTSCNTVLAGPTPVASCSPSGASGANNYVATTCGNVTTPATGAASCNPGTDSNFVTTTCSTTTSGPTLVASCTQGTSGNFTVTSCTTETLQNGQPVASCANSNASAGNGFIKTACATTTSGYSNNPSCVAAAPTAGNNFVATQCQDVQVTAPTPVLPSNCTPGTSSNNTTTCTPRQTLQVPVASCVPNTTGPSFVACSQVVTGPTPVAACTPGGGASTNYVYTTCQTTTTPYVNAPSCTPVAAGPGNGYVATTCNPSVLTVGVPPGSCVAQAPTAANNYVTIECPAASTTGPTPVLLGSCTNVAPSAANQYIATTCTTTGPTTPAPVASCTAGTSANFTVTTCSNNNSAIARVLPGSCTDVAAAPGNQYTATACTASNSTVGVAAGSCTPITPSAANNYLSVTCNNVATGPTFVPLGSCTAGTDGNFVTTTCSTVNQGPTFVASCAAGTDANYKVTTCSINATGPVALAPGSACTNQAASASNSWTSTVCTPSDVSLGVAAGSCVPSAPGVLPITTCSTTTTELTPVASCTAGTDSNFSTSTCVPEVVGPERTSSCTPAVPVAGNGFQSTTCTPIGGLKIQTKTRTLTTLYTVSGSTVLESTGVPGTPVETNWADAGGGMCYVDPQRPPVVDTTPDWHQSTTGMPNGCSAWPCAGALNTSSAVLGSVNSLADVAQYYYTTDLRASVTGANPDPGKDDVPKLGSGIEDDRAPWQHMTTFVVGLGVAGSLDYRADYRAGTGDFAKIRSYENTPPLNWPIWPPAGTVDQLAYNDPRSIDDYWHTAVNGRGKFFSAKDPQSVVDGLKEALAGIEAQAGAGAGAATSTLTPTAGDNTAYTGSFTSSEWTGDVQSQDIDIATGNLSSTVKWSARTLLDLATGADCDNRKIFARDPTGGSLVDFSWNTFACSAGVASGAASSALPTALRSYFSDASALGALSQFATAGGTASQLAEAGGAKLVNFLRGQRGNEGFVANVAGKLFRTRTHVLGDIVNSQPTYVKAPSLSYQDSGYDTFKSGNSARTPMVYVGANDGMLHAFFAPDKATDPNIAKAGQEAWAYVPTAVMSKLWKLADSNYAEKHIFTVDGTPTVGDFFDSSANRWKTILVGGLNSGGEGYYALDITDPVNPKSLWEFGSGGCAANPVGATSDCNVGLTFGRPVITKLKNGKWVVMVTSGYNNVSASGSDGKGYLYVLDAASGQVISRIGTGAGSTATPSGLKDINFFVSNVAYDNTAQRVYGADILGNVWRFDVNDVIAPAGLEATLLGTARDAGGNAQPITTRPELAEVSGNTMVIVATGRLLSTSDLTDTSAQSVYAIKDPMSANSPAYANLRASLKPLQLTQTGSGALATRKVSCAGATVADCSDLNGWFIDLPDGGERVNVDMQSVLGTLVFASNVPSNTLCVAGGYSWLNYVNLVNGEAVASSEGGVVSVPFFESSVVVGLGLVGLPDGTIKALGRSAVGDTKAIKIPVGSPPPLGKRISWREITQ